MDCIYYLENEPSRIYHLTQDWFDRRFSELGRECETNRNETGWITESRILWDRATTLGDFYNSIIEGNTQDTKLSACESCLRAVVENLEKREKK